MDISSFPLTLNVLNQTHASSPGSPSAVPSSFIISFHYKPRNNTVLRLFSTHNHSLHPSTSRTSSSNPSHTPHYSTSLYLSSDVVFLQGEDSYWLLWANVSLTQWSRVALVVSNGYLSSCLNGALLLGDTRMRLWRTEADAPLQLTFSPSVEQLTAIVSLCVCVAGLMLTFHGSVIN